MCAPGSKGPLKDDSTADKLPLPDVSKEQKQQQQKCRGNLKRGVHLGTASLALLFIATTVTMPHLQSQRDGLGCDSMCLGSMTSVRSMLTLAGSTLVGKLSDSTAVPHARRICLILGIVASATGLVLGFLAQDLNMLWASMIPGALLQHNTNVFKALFSAYHDAVPEQSSTDRAASSGLLGMAMGLALMAGPLAGVQVFSTYQQATMFGLVCSVVAAGLVLAMPTPSVVTSKKFDSKQGKASLSFFSALDIPSARSPAALFLMTSRVCMSLSFHIFQTIWTASLKQRFHFGPKDYGSFISFIGLTYALSQGFLAKFILTRCGGHSARGRVRLLLLCCVLLGGGRFLAFQTHSLAVVYGLFAAIVTALGLVNTIFSADTSQIAPPDEIGALYGVLAAVESAAGMAGPLAGGALSYVHPIKAPLTAVIGLYGLVFSMVFFGYERIVLKSAMKKENADLQKKTI